jgi:VWFA-related protein
VPESQATPVFATGTELATIEVGVVDQTGRPVRGLTPADFTLEVDGAPRTVLAAEFVRHDASVGPPPSDQHTSNEGAEGGRLLMLVVDQNGVRPGIGPVLGRAADRLLGNLGPGDRVGLSSLPLGQLVGFTAHVALVRERLSRVIGSAEGPVTRTGRAGAMAIADAIAVTQGDRRVLEEVSSRECGQIPNDQLRENCTEGYAADAQSIAFQVRDQTQGMLIALRQLLMRLEQVPGRKTVVLLSEGIVLEDRVDEVAWVAGLTARARVSLYAVQLSSAYVGTEIPTGRTLGSPASDRRLRETGLRTLVALAGGLVLTASAGPETAFSRISAELTGYYRLAFAPLEAERDGKERPLAVRVRRAGMEVRAPRVYAAGGPRDAMGTDEDRLVAALQNPLLETGRLLRVATYNAPDASPGTVRVTVAAGLGRGDEETPVRTVAFMVVDRDGKVVMSRAAPPERRTSRDHRFQVALQLDPGPYTLKVAAVDAAGRRGSVEHRFDAKVSSAGPVVMGDLALLDAAAAQAGELRPGIEPVVRDDRVVAYLELGSSDVDGLAAVSVRLEVAREPNAEALDTRDLAVRPAASPSRRVAQGLLPLGALPPGDYVARAFVVVDGRPLGRVLRPFRYDPASEVRARQLSRGLGPLGGGAASFDRTSVLAPAVAGFFLAQAGTALPPGDALTRSAMEMAAEGRYTDIPEVLSGATPEGPVIPFLRGLGLLARAELDPAADQFREALRFSSEFTPATFYLGACYAAGGRDREAVGAWQTTIAADTVAPFIHGLTAEAYLRLGDNDAALTAASEGLAAAPDDDALRMVLVQAHARAGRPADALGALDPYLARRASDAEAHFLAMRLLYESIVAGGKAAGQADRARFDRYLAAYAAAGGGQVALAGSLRAALERPPAR